MQTNLSAQQRAKSLRFSFLDEIFASTTVGFTQEYFTPFLLLLGATSRHIAMLNALPNLFASLIQFKIQDFVESVKSRRKVINSFIFLQAVLLGLVLIYVHQILSMMLYPLPSVQDA